MKTIITYGEFLMALLITMITSSELKNGHGYITMNGEMVKLTLRSTQK